MAGPEGPPEGAQGGAMAPVAHPLGTSLRATDNKWRKRCCKCDDVSHY